MKQTATSILVGLMFTSSLSIVSAFDPPKARKKSDYYHLHQNSPFTEKPEKAAGPKIEVKNDLDDWTLIGFTKATTGNTATILNTKKQDERVTVDSNTLKEDGFRILEIDHNLESFHKSRVHIQKGKHQKWIEFDKEYLVLKKSAPRAKAPARNARPNSRNSRSNATPPTPGSTPKNLEELGSDMSHAVQKNNL